MTEIVLSNLTDLIGQIFIFLTNVFIYLWASFADYVLQIFDVPYYFITFTYNCVIELLSIIPEVLSESFSWILELYPAFSFMLSIAVVILTIHLIIRLIKLLLDLIPIL